MHGGMISRYVFLVGYDVKWFEDVLIFVLGCFQVFE